MSDPVGEVGREASQPQAAGSDLADQHGQGQVQAQEPVPLQVTGK